jgi:hypothetical protein
MIRLNNDYEILTPNGFVDFYGIRRIEKDSHLVIKLSNGKTLKCSNSHPFMCKGVKVSADLLKFGDNIDSSTSKKVSVVDIIVDETPLVLFDILNVGEGNVFNVDGIVSHNCDFTTSGHSVIEADILKWYKETTIKEPIEMRGNDKGLWIWEYPSYIKSYLICADVARGDGADKSAFHVIDIENLTQVAEYRGVIDTKSYGNLLVSVATEYNNAILVVENNNIGWATLQQIIDRSYPNTFYSSADATYVDVERQMVGNINRMDKKMIPGFTTTSKTRPLIISKLETYLRERSFGLHSSRTWDELSVFMWNGNKAEAMGGYNDDLVTSLGIGLWVRDTALRLRSESDEYRKSLITNISKTQNSGVYSRSNDDAKNSWSMPVDSGNKFNSNSVGQREDLSWLL